MLDKEAFRKTEGRLYRYYTQFKLIDKLKHKVVTLYKQLEAIKEDLKNTNIKIDPIESKSMDYSKERVTSSNNGTSYAENEIMRAIEKLENEYIYKKKKMLKLHARIRQMEEEIEDMNYNISLLSEESKRFIEWKYSDKKSIEFIAQNLNIATATAYRKREELVEEIAQFNKLVS